jgi:hypothetical protein
VSTLIDFGKINQEPNYISKFNDVDLGKDKLALETSNCQVCLLLSPLYIFEGSFAFNMMLPWHES